MKTFAIVFQGESYDSAEPLLFTDSPEAVRPLVSYLADRAEGGAALMTDVDVRKPSTRRRRTEEQGARQ